MIGSIRGTLLERWGDGELLVEVFDDRLGVGHQAGVGFQLLPQRLVGSQFDKRRVVGIKAQVEATPPGTLDERFARFVGGSRFHGKNASTNRAA